MGYEATRVVTGMTSKPAIPENADAVTAEWLRQALSTGLSENLPEVASLVVENIGAGSGTLGEILRCSIRYGDDGKRSPGSVIVKLSSSNRNSLRIAKTLSMYKREYACFRQLVPHMKIGVPKLLYGDFEERSHRFVLVLEDLGEMVSLDQIAGANARQTGQVVRNIARMHGQFWNRVDQPPLSEFMSFVGPQKAWLSQLIYLICLAPCLDRFGHLFPNGMRTLAEAFGSRVADHIHSLATGPQTLTHGDFRLENMFFSHDGTDSLTVIDWQTTGLIGDGLYDVAYFMASSVPTEVRREIEREALTEYHDVLREAGVHDMTFEACWRAYRRNMFGMLLPSVCACGGLDMENERIRRLGELILARTLMAIEDLEASEFLPTRGLFPISANTFSFLSSGAYRTYSLSYRLGRRGMRVKSA